MINVSSAIFGQDCLVDKHISIRADSRQLKFSED